MKFIIAIIIITCVSVAYASEPLTTCPAGYQTVQYTANTIADTCPSGYATIANVSSCLDTNPVGDCWMYIDVGQSFTDDAGTYSYTSVCPLE